MRQLPPLPPRRPLLPLAPLSPSTASVAARATRVLLSALLVRRALSSTVSFSLSAALFQKLTRCLHSLLLAVPIIPGILGKALLWRSSVSAAPIRLAPVKLSF